METLILAVGCLSLAVGLFPWVRLYRQAPALYTRLASQPHPRGGVDARSAICKANALRHTLATLFFVATFGVSAQDPIRFEAEGPAKEVAEGSRFEVSFSLNNATAKRFVPPDFKGMRVTAGPSELRSAGFVNGKSYSRQAWTYELEAGAPGTYTIGPAMVQTAGQTLRSQPLTIRVGKAKPVKNKKPAPGSDNRLFLSAELDRESALVGQQVLYQVKLYTQVGVAEYDILELPQPEGIFTRERRRFDTRVQYQTVRGKKYAVRILYEMALFPQQPGVLSIGPAHVRVGVEAGGSGLRALMGSVPMLLQTPPVTLTVNALPDPAPDNFTGGVGAYSWSVSADKSSLTTDDALTLTVSIEGNGDPRRFSNPRFDLPDGLEGFEPKALEQEEYETGEQYVHACKLEYVILPKQPGSYTLLPEMVVFDPDSNGYRTLHSAVPIQLTVTPGPNFGKSTAPLDTVASPAAPRPTLELLWQQMTPWLPNVAAGVLTAVLLVALIAWFSRRKKRNTNPEAAANPIAERPRPNPRQLRNRLQEIQRLIPQNEPKVFYLELLKAVQNYVAARIDAEPTTLTEQLMREKLTERGVPQPTVEALARVWQACEKSVFAGQASSDAMRPTWDMADAALRELAMSD